MPHRPLGHARCGAGPSAPPPFDSSSVELGALLVEGPAVPAPPPVSGSLGREATPERGLLELAGDPPEGEVEVVQGLGIRFNRHRHTVS